MTILLCIWVVLLSGFWRLWLGGTPRDWPFPRGVTQFKYLVGMGLAGGIVWHITQDWRPAVIAALGYILIWRGYGHGPMLQLPLGTNETDKILALVNRLVPPPEDRDAEWKWKFTPNVRWFLYGAIRYVMPCAAIGALMAIFGARWWPMALGGVGILAGYWISWKDRLSQDYDFIRWIANLSPVRNYRDSLQPYAFGALYAGASLMIGIIGSVWP